MEGITITVSSKLHDLLKRNGLKGESYEHIILRMARQEFLQDYRKFQSPAESKEKPKLVQEQAVLKKPVKKVQKPVAKPSAKKPEKQAKAKPLKPQAVKKKPKPSAKAKKAKKIPEKLPIKSEKIAVSNELKQWQYTKNLELQGLKTELELAKLSNDTAKINEITLRLAKLKQEFEQKKLL